MSAKRLPAEKRRRQILRSATAVFARRGFNGATTKQIAAEADVAEALLYRYFKSKHALFTASVEMTSTRLLEELGVIFETHREDPVAALEATLTFYRDVLARHGDMAKMVFMVSAELDDPAVREVYLPFQDAALRLIGERISDWQQRGLVRKTLPVRAAAWLIMGTYQVVTLMKLTGHEGELDDVSPAAIIRDIMVPPEARKTSA